MAKQIGQADLASGKIQLTERLIISLKVFKLMIRPEIEKLLCYVMLCRLFIRPEIEELLLLSFFICTKNLS